jgi:hypothetical protein
VAPAGTRNDSGVLAQHPPVPLRHHPRPRGPGLQDELLSGQGHVGGGRRLALPGPGDQGEEAQDHQHRQDPPRQLAGVEAADRGGHLRHRGLPRIQRVVLVHRGGRRRRHHRRGRRDPRRLRQLLVKPGEAGVVPPVGPSGGHHLAPRALPRRQEEVAPSPPRWRPSPSGPRAPAHRPPPCSASAPPRRRDLRSRCLPHRRGAEPRLRLRLRLRRALLQVGLHWRALPRRADRPRSRPRPRPRRPDPSAAASPPSDS